MTPAPPVDEQAPVVVDLGDRTVLVAFGPDAAGRLTGTGSRPVLGAALRFEDGRGTALADDLCVAVAAGPAGSFPARGGWAPTPADAEHHPEAVGWPGEVQSDVPDALPRPATGDGLRATLLRLAAEHRAGPAWTTAPYGTGEDLVHADDAAVVRLDPQTGAGLAVALAADGRGGALDPSLGARLAVATAYRAVVATGARPRAVVSRVHAGPSERQAAHWHLERVVAGVADACRELGLASTGEVTAADAGPGRPVVVAGVLGAFDDVGRATPAGWLEPGQVIYQLGATRADLGGSLWAHVEHGHLGGLPPAVDAAAERLLGDLLVNSSRDGLVDAARAVAEGGLARALVAACLRSGVGARVWLDGVCERDGVTPFEALFAESAGRAVVAVPRSEEIRFTDMCTARGYPVARIGVVDDQAGPDGGQALDVQGLFTVPLDELRAAAG